MLSKVTMALLSVVSLLASPPPPQSSPLDDRLRSLDRRLECLRSGEEPGFTGPPAVAQVREEEANRCRRNPFKRCRETVLRT